ncbi:transposase [Pontibacter russatus]|uniref:transposase n=1 Tax=Pontibacter russatus TaxID=2694929 RepID=UPI00137A4263|nr:transposase [Pontibacter russatus]
MTQFVLQPLPACGCKLSPNSGLCFSQVETFDNSTRGFNQLLKWSRKQTTPALPVSFVMEATGVYYEPLAYHLHKLKQAVSVLLPNKVRHFGKSLSVKSKTDRIDARIIALLSAHEPQAFVLKSHKEVIKKFDTEIAKCEARIKAVLKKEEWLQEKAERLLSIKGVGLMSLAIVLAETQGFALMNNSKQLTSYAGFDVVERESGTRVRGKTRISKKGNGRIRAALYFPALVASRHNAALPAVYQRINAGKESKMVGVVSLQRKLLLLNCSMWISDTVFQDKPLASGDQERRPLLRNKDEAFENKVGRSTDLPTLDELPYDLSRVKPSFVSKLYERFS